MSTGIKKACCQLLSNHWLHWHFYCNLLGDLQAYETCSWYNKNSKRTRNSLVTDWTTSCNLSQINLSISHSTVKTSASRPLKWWCVFIWHWTSANLQIPVEQEHHIQTGCVNIYSNYGGGISSAISSVEGWKRIQLYPMISQPSLCIIGRGCGMQSGIWLCGWRAYTQTQYLTHCLHAQFAGCAKPNSYDTHELHFLLLPYTIAGTVNLLKCIWFILPCSYMLTQAHTNHLNINL